MEHQDFDSLMEKGQEAYSSGRYEAAVEAYKEAIQLNPDNAEAHNGLGVAYAALDRYEDAIEAHKEAVRLGRRYATSHSLLGSAYAGLGRYEEAIEAHKEAIRLEPYDAMVFYFQGMSLGLLGHPEKAVVPLKMAVLLAPNNADMCLAFGMACSESDDYEGAMEQYEILKELDSNKASELNKFLRKRQPSKPPPWFNLLLYCVVAVICLFILMKIIAPIK